MSNSSMATRELAATTVVQEWVEGYLTYIYGNSLASEVGNMPELGEKTVNATDSSAKNESEDFVSRLSARFSELDLAPRDGVVTLFEVERAIANPLLHFDERDIEMLKLLRRYFVKLSELNDNQPDELDHGITRADVSVLTNCMSLSVQRLRTRLEDEYRAT